MTPETKAWILQVRKRAAKLHAGSHTNPWNDLEDALIQIERLEEIIESQEKEIERLKAIEEKFGGYSRWCNICGKVFQDYVGDEENKRLKEEIERLNLEIKQTHERWGDLLHHRSKRTDI